MGGIDDFVFYSVERDIHYGAVNRTNLFYGSVYPEVTRLVSIHGSLDPWMTMGVHSDINEEAPVIIVPGIVDFYYGSGKKSSQNSANRKVGKIRNQRLFVT